ncbi:MAG TPA: helix-turn-helix domain-containing GNAT family N-acetyltransferase [Terracidiphilus sp.]|jgi:DNA-binding MarR family transcriptional regulator/GNAT superfamily N-acetyltransferase
MASPDPSLAPTVASFRQFNRAYTRFLGTLNDRYLHTDFSLAEGRVLYELATHPSLQAKEIADALGLDAGYLSRILAKFKKAGFVSRATSNHDRRAANLQITVRGRAAVRTLNLRADKQAAAVLEKLSSSQRAEFSRALNTVEQIVVEREPAESSIVLRNHRPGDMGMVVHTEGAGYVEQFGWDTTFEALVARIAADFLEKFDPARERCWVAEMDGRHVGHIFLVRHPEQRDTAKLRLLYVDPAARGMGLGHQLVNECVQFARQVGYTKITLWTQSILTAAHRIYQAAGFRLVHEEAHHSFGKDLVGQTWEMDLA